MNKTSRTHILILLVCVLFIQILQAIAIAQLRNSRRECVEVVFVSETRTQY